MHKPGMVSIWFLVGLLLTAYGLLISAHGVYQALVPPVHPPCWPICTPASGGLGDFGNRAVLLLALPASENEISSTGARAGAATGS